jgi:hypothetical protein
MRLCPYQQEGQAHAAAAQRRLQQTIALLTLPFDASPAVDGNGLISSANLRDCIYAGFGSICLRASAVTATTHVSIAAGCLHASFEQCPQHWVVLVRLFVPHELAD